MTKQAKKDNRELEIIKLRREYINETGVYLYDEIAKYADWLEKKVIELKQIKNK